MVVKLIIRSDTMAEEEDISPEEFTESCMLGFLERDSRNELFEDPDYRNWDGGKVGGTPVWLDRVHLPSPSHMTCETCADPLLFLLQIYCPLDQPESAYHRCLYLFCCRRASCVQKGSVKCLRTQCSEIEWNSAREKVPSELCCVCGCRGSFSCSRCRSAHYCSKSHQKIDWAAHKSHCEKLTSDVVPTTAVSAVPSILFPEYDMVVAPEVIGDELVQGDESAKALASAMEPDDIGSDEDDDENLTQSDYDKAIGAESKDPMYIKFLARVRRGGADQVLRYIQPRGIGSVDSPAPKPLPISTGSTIDASLVQSCQYCGAPRHFEFQVLPQLLYYLNVDRNTAISPGASILNEKFHNPNNEDIDWNSIDVYTCSTSCRSNGLTETYKEEFVYLQVVPYVRDEKLMSDLLPTK